MSWTSAPLGELCEINVGRTPARANPAFWGAGEPWLSIADMSQGRVIRETKEQITELAAKNGRRVAPGTVVLSFKLSIGKVARTSIPLYTNEAIAALPVLDEGVLDAEYLAWALEALDLREDSNRAAMGATLNKAKLDNIRISFPQLPEQRRITAILNRTAKIITDHHRILNSLDAFEESIFHYMFGGEPATTVVEHVATQARTGPFGSQLLHGEFVDEGVAVLGLDNVVGNEFRWVERRFVTPAKYEKLKRYTVHPGDVLVSIMGTTGRCVVVPDGIQTAINTKHLCAIRVDRDRIEPEFLRATFLYHPQARAYLRQQTKGAIMDGLNMGIIKSMPMLTPPPQRQRDFVHRVERVNGRRAAARRRLKAVQELFASLQARAFRGEL